MPLPSGRRPGTHARRRFVPLVFDRLENRVVLSGTRAPVATYIDLNDGGLSHRTSAEVPLQVSVLTISAGVSGAPQYVGSGTVTIYAGSTPIDTLDLSTGEPFITTTLPAGPYAFTAVYNGNSEYAPSTSEPVQASVLQGETAVLFKNPSTSEFDDQAGTVITASSEPGEPVTFTAEVITGVGSPPELPTGTITFHSGSFSGTANLVNGIATFTTSSLPVGDDYIEATYSGDSNFEPGNSNEEPLGFTTFGLSNYGYIPEYVQSVGTPVTVSVTSSANPIPFNTPVTFNVTVTESEAPVPTGTVTYDNQAVTLVNGQATFTADNLNPGPNFIDVGYSGDANYAPSGGGITKNVGKATPVLQLGQPKAFVNAVVAPIQSDEPIILTASFANVDYGRSTPTPSGTVTFYDGSTALATEVVESGEGVNTSNKNIALGVGTHHLTAKYSGDGLFNPVTSTTETVVVTPAGTSVNLGVATSPVSYGAAVTITAKVTSWEAPAGSVVFYDGSTTLGTATLSNGIASLHVSSLSPGLMPSPLATWATPTTLRAHRKQDRSSSATRTNSS